MITLNLNHYMDQEGFSIQDVAKMTGLSRNTISQLYNNTGKGIQFETLNRLAKALSISVHDLLIETFEVLNLLPKVSFIEEFKDITFDTFLDCQFYDGDQFFLSIPITAQKDSFFLSLTTNRENVDYDTLFKFQDYVDGLSPHDREWLFLEIARQSFKLQKEKANETPTDYYQITFNCDLTYTSGIFYNWNPELLDCPFLSSEYIISKYKLSGMCMAIKK